MQVHLIKTMNSVDHAITSLVFETDRVVCHISLNFLDNKRLFKVFLNALTLERFFLSFAPPDILLIALCHFKTSFHVLYTHLLSDANDSESIRAMLSGLVVMR